MTMDKNIPNSTKKESYTYAFKQINIAIKATFYLEAITLCESIISDRLLSHLKGVGIKKLKLKTSLAELIIEWKKFDKKIVWKERNDLISDLNDWRVFRNNCIHSAAKAEPMSPTTPIEEFVANSKLCSEQGKKLARDICDWHKKKLKEAK
jgi:hypothetical protein